MCGDVSCAAERRPRRSTRPGARMSSSASTRLMSDVGWVQASHAVTLPRAVLWCHCIDIEGLHNPVDQWRGGGRWLDRKLRRRIPLPAEVLPQWHQGIEASVRNPVRDAFRMGLLPACVATRFWNCAGSGLTWPRWF